MDAESETGIAISQRGTPLSSAQKLAEAMFQLLGVTPSKLAEHLPALAIVVVFIAITFLAYLSQGRNNFVHSVSRYLYLLPILGAGYQYGRDNALVVSLASTALFIPRLVDLIGEAGSVYGSIELSAAILFFNLFGLLVSGLTDFDRRHRKLLDTVDQLGEVIEKSLDLESLLPAVLRHSALLCDAEGGEVLFSPGADGNVLVKEVGRPILHHSDAMPQMDVMGQAFIPFSNWLMEHNRPMIIADLENDPRFYLPGANAFQRTSLLVLPIRRGGQPIGLIALWRFGDNVFRDDEIDLLKVLADKSQMAIENAKLHLQTSEALSTLLEASTAFASTLELEQVLQTLCERMVAATDAKTCRLYRLVDGGLGLSLSAEYDPEQQIGSDQKDESTPWADRKSTGTFVSIDSVPWLVAVIQRGEPTILDKQDTGTKLTAEERSVVFAKEAQRVIAVPIGATGRTIGVAILASDQTVEATTQEHEKIELCQAIAKQGALAIENIQAVESIAREGRLIQLIIDNVADGVFSTDLAGNIVAFNPAAEVITGFKAEKVIGHNYATVLAGKPEQNQEPTQTDELLQQMVAYQEEPAAVHRKTWIKRRDGQQVRVAHSMAPLIDQSGQITGTVSVLRDVSKEEELVRLKSEFISLVSHQLRTPLTSISASAELLAGDDLNTASRTNLVQTLTQQTSRLKRLVNQVLEASRLETGEINLLLEPLALSPLLEQTVRIHRIQHPSHEFEIRLPETPLIVMGDRESLEIVLDNLLQNAVNYSPKNSRVTVNVEDRPDQLVIGVADEGVGIPQEHIEQIFERFRRLPSSKRGTGFGLGLHITKLLVEKQGGQIWVESEVGRGSCFYFTLRKLGDFNE